MPLPFKWENDDDIKLPSMASSFSRDPLSTLLQPVLEGLFSQGNPILGICGEKALSVLDALFAMYATQEFYSFSLILPVFVLSSKYIAEEEGAGG